VPQTAVGTPVALPAGPADSSGSPPKVAVPPRQADTLSLGQGRLGGAVGAAGGIQGNPNPTIATAGGAPARPPAGAAVPVGSPQTVAAAVVVPGKQPLTAAVNNTGADTGAEANARIVGLAAGPGPHVAGRDAFFQAALQGRGERMRSPTGDGAGVAAALGNLVGAVGLGGGKDGSEVPGPAVENLAAGGPVLLALLGTPWAARDEEVESRRARRPRRR
jgi:hypothetical protein